MKQNHHSKERFDFSNFKPKDFEKHIRSSIPNYSGLRMLIPSIASNYIKDGTTVLDLGCSTGDLLIQLSEMTNTKALFLGIDRNENLFTAKDQLPENVKLEEKDIEVFLGGFWGDINLITSLFTLQFLDRVNKQDVLDDCYKNLNDGGAMIVCEKIISKDAKLNSIFEFSNYDLKVANGLSEKEILDKQRDLRFIMNPITIKENEAMFKRAGFKTQEVFFKSLNFIGWVLTK